MNALTMWLFYTRVVSCYMLKYIHIRMMRDSLAYLTVHSAALCRI